MMGVSGMPRAASCRPLSLDQGFAVDPPKVPAGVQQASAAAKARWAADLYKLQVYNAESRAKSARLSRAREAHDLAELRPMLKLNHAVEQAPIGSRDWQRILCF